MPTSILVNASVSVSGYHLPLNEALDLDGYREFSAYVRATQVALGAGTTKGVLKLYEAARNNVADYVEITGADLDITADTSDFIYVSSFSRFIIAALDWDHADGGSCKLEVLIVPKK